MMAIDESTSIKNIGTATKPVQRTKNCISLGELAEYRRILTGSPVTRSPLDLYAQCEFLKPGILGHQSFYSFRKQYAILQQRVVRVGVDQKTGKNKYRKIKIVVGYRNQKKLNNLIQGFSVRYLKEDCFDLPRKSYQTRYVELTTDQRRLYDGLVTDALGELEDGSQVSVNLALVKLLRLQQIICGHVQWDDEQKPEPIHNNRIQAMLEICRETSSKIIIWARFVHDIETIVETLQEEFGDEAVVSYYGKTTDDERRAAVKNFEDPNSLVRFFIGNQATGGYGLTLIQGTTVIYYSNSFSLEHRIQSEDRAHRAGQTNRVNYVDLICRGTIDEHIVKALRDKKDIASEVMGDEVREWIK